MLLAFAAAELHRQSWTQYVNYLFILPCKVQLPYVYSIVCDILNAMCGDRHVPGGLSPVSIHANGLQLIVFVVCADDASSTQTYVLRSIIPTPLRQQLVDDMREDSVSGLLMLVLALISMNGDKMESDELWRHLRRLGVTQEEEHPVFGHVKKELEKFERTR